jgi:glyceraldehyde-3-phosphate dehydrogenase (NADP+)
MEMIIAGQRVRGSRRMEVCNPYDGSVTDTVPLATADEREAAVQAAVAARPLMRALPAHERAAVLGRTSGLIEAHANELQRLIALESGKTIREAATEVARAVQTFRLSAAAALDITGETVPFDAAPGAERKMGFYLREPVGVVLAITPFNFPLNLPAHKIAPAIAAGCPVIFKPASATPLTGVRLGELLLEAGLPPQGISVLTGRVDVLGDPLVADERIRKVSFTGSAAVGKHLTTIAGLKRLTLELGSDSAVVVMADADLAAAAKRIVVGAYAQAGQVCISVQRLFVQRDVFDDFLALFQPLVEALRVGDQMLEETDVGPMIDEGAARQTEERLAQAVAGGARVLCGGQRNGTLVTPAILTNVPRDCFFGCEEAFAPLVILRPFDTLDEALAELNASAYGLQAGIYTRDLATAWAFIKGTEVGGVMVNEIPTFRADLMPYGGVKDSGLGREGPKFAVEEMTELKLVAFNL